MGCMTQQHDYGVLLGAALVCMLGACPTARTLIRLAAAIGPRRREQLVMSSLIAAATIRATHFIAMLAYDPGVEHGYEPVLTGLSLCIAALGAFGTNTFFAYGPRMNLVSFISPEIKPDRVTSPVLRFDCAGSTASVARFYRLNPSPWLRNQA
jgi:hypothetical protein